MIHLKRWHGGPTERSADQAHPVVPQNFWASYAAWRWALRHRVPARISVKSWIDGSVQ